MSDVDLILRWLHIIAGGIALLSGPFAMARQDGSQFHRLAGRFFYYSMTVVILSSFRLAMVRDSLFLFLVALFSSYLLASGIRALHLKNLHRDQRPLAIDWFILVASASTGIALLAWGLWVAIAKLNSFALVPAFFGLVMVRSCWSDYQRFTKKPSDKKHWLYTHISGMVGCYIATVTAFLVNNVDTNPAFIGWLLPSLILVPFIVITIRKFKQKGRYEKLPGRLQ